MGVQGVRPLTVEGLALSRQGRLPSLGPAVRNSRRTTATRVMCSRMARP